MTTPAVPEEYEEYVTVQRWQFVVGIIVLKMIGIASMTASSLVIRDIALKQLKTSYPASSRELIQTVSKVSLTQSIMFFLSLGDCLSSFFVPFISTWMVPSDVPVPFSSGTTETCTAQGFLGVFFFGMSVYSNATLAVAYCLIVRYGWSDSEKRNARPLFTLTPILCTTALAIVPLFGDSYNFNGGYHCDIQGYPLGCNWDESTTVCTRGANALDMLLYVQLIPYMVTFVIIIVSVLLLIYSVYKQESRMDRYRPNQETSRKMTSQTTWQGIWYIAAFGIAWLPWYIATIVEECGESVPAALHYFQLLTKPSQGVLNASVYFRPRYKSERQRHPSEPRLSIVFRVLRIDPPKLNCCTFSTRGQTTNADAPVVNNGTGEIKTVKFGEDKTHPISGLGPQSEGNEIQQDIGGDVEEFKE